MGGGGSSGVHAMDGQSGDGAREGETLGKGGSHPESEALGTGGHPESETLGKGGSDAHNDKNDDVGSNAGGAAQTLGGAYQATRLPTQAASKATATLLTPQRTCGMSLCTLSTETGTTRRLLRGSLGRGASCVAIGVASGMMKCCTSIWTLM